MLGRWAHATGAGDVFLSRALETCAPMNLIKKQVNLTTQKITVLFHDCLLHVSA